MSVSPATPSPTTAINAALAQNWEEAVAINLQIIDQDATNIDAYNRLGFAYAQLKKLDKAKKAYEAVIKQDKYNQVAQKNLLKLANNNGAGLNAASIASPLMFLEEPGKTKIVPLVNLAPVKVIESLSCAQEVKMKVKKHVIEIRDESGIYLGALPDDTSFKLTKYIEGGNEYKIVIRSIAKNALTIFIREISRGEKYKNQPSFTPASTYIAQGKFDDANEKPDTTVTGEEAEE